MPIHILGPREPRNPEAINTTSRSRNWSRRLSPFFLGPVKLYGEHVAENVENGWQFSKVYSQHADASGQPTREYWQWAQTGWASTYAHRYPAGKGAVPLYSLWNGEKLDYIQARRRIYIPLYAEAVKSTEAFQQLKAIYQREGEIWLWDFDGYDNTGLSWEQIIADPTRKMGHAFVLGMILDGHI